MDTSVYLKSFITSTHYQHITVLPKDTPFTCSSAEFHFNVLYVTLVSKQICLKQLKSITLQTAHPKRYVSHQLFPYCLENVQFHMFDLTLNCISDMNRLKAYF